MKKWGYLLALLIMLESLSAVLYLGTAEQFGFPLDDAWIHQTYARNLGLHGLMAFSPDEPSTGSTSPGWTTLLAAGYLLGVPFFHWAYIWGGLFAIASAFTAARLSQSYFGGYKRAAIVAIICIIEWHLAWAALSGMEISLFTFLTLLILLSLHHNLSPILIGLLIGLTFLVRPEGIVFAFIYGLKLLFTNRGNLRQFLTTIGAFAVIFLIVISPWVIFNLVYNGRPFPSTISSKFMQYGYPWSLWNSLKYLLKVFIYFLDGPLMLLMPGAVIAIYSAFRQRKTNLYYPVAWLLILIGLYAVALPAIYHHGRYLMPLIPIIVIFGIAGFFNILEKLSKKSPLAPGAWLVFGGMVLALWINGASTFALQIRLLTESHMQAARWVDANAPRDAIIATHDIGIIGYVTQRQIVDLAGLVTPEIIPIMNDQYKLASFVRERHVTYLVVFSGYYEKMLTQLDAHSVFSPNEVDLRSMNLEPFEVFEVLPP
jgi:arabinofuranosyltransferase